LHSMGSGWKELFVRESHAHCRERMKTTLTRVLWHQVRVVLVVALLLAGLVLSSGYTLWLTNKDGFCVSCHVMRPFRSSWVASAHGGANRHGVVVQCVNCHLPHDSPVRFVRIKVQRGLAELVANFSIDPKMVDWAGKARQNRTSFTYDSGCRSCHGALSVPAARPVCSGQQGRPAEHCVTCHPHVGHRDVIVVAERFFHDVAE